MNAKALRVDGWLNGNEQTILSGEINGAGELPVTADDLFFPDNKIILNRVRRLKRRGCLAVEQALDRHGELKKSVVKRRSPRFPLCRMTHFQSLTRWTKCCQRHASGGAARLLSN